MFRRKISLENAEFCKRLQAVVFFADGSTGRSDAALERWVALIPRAILSPRNVLSAPSTPPSLGVCRTVLFYFPEPSYSPKTTILHRYEMPPPFNLDLVARSLERAAELGHEDTISTFSIDPTVHPDEPVSSGLAPGLRSLRRCVIAFGEPAARRAVVDIVIAANI